MHSKTLWSGAPH